MSDGSHISEHTMTSTSSDERRTAAKALRNTVEAIERGEIEGDAFARGYLSGVADTLDPPRAPAPTDEPTAR